VDDFFHHYTEILTDPAHLAVEVTLMLVVDVLFLGLIWPFITRYFNHKLHQQHQILDAEHGIQHHDDHVHHDDHIHPVAAAPVAAPVAASAVECEDA
jgi:hypothetical protein